MQTILNTPVFMTPRTTQQAMPSIGEPLPRSMSPLQAFHLTQTLIDQKFFNPLYQVTPTVWDQNTGALVLTREAQTASVTRLAASESQKKLADELQSDVDRAVSSMTIADGLAIIENGMRLLGLNQ
jgi:hypothetical protein